MNEIEQLRLRVAELEAKFGSRFNGEDVTVRRVIFQSRSIYHAGPDDQWWIGLHTGITGSEEDGDEENPTGGMAVINGIAVGFPGTNSAPTKLAGGTVRVYGIRLSPVDNVYIGETDFNTGRTDLVQATMHIVLRGRQLAPGVDFTYSRSTGYVTFTLAPFRAGETLPTTAAAVLFCFSAEAELGIGV